MKELDRELHRRERAEKTKPLGVVLATLAILAVIGGGIWVLTTWGSEDEATDVDTTAAEQTPEPQDATPLAMKRAQPLGETVTCDYTDTGDGVKDVDLPSGTDVPATGTVTVTLQTTAGEIPMELDRALSPCAVNSVVHLAESGFYDDVICHRLTEGGIFVLQCGDPAGNGTGGPGYSFADEYPVDEADNGAAQQVIYPEGSIAMANSGPNTNGSQFFLNYADGTLPPSYSVLGMMSDEGLQTVKGVADKGTEEGSETPKEEVRITGVTVK
nr:peptidylprolyl isomerase [Corynebacterium sp. TAE3-ERU12]